MTEEKTAADRAVHNWPGYGDLDRSIWIRREDAAKRYCISSSALSQNKKLETRRLKSGSRTKVFFRVEELDAAADTFQRGQQNTARWLRVRRTVLGLDKTARTQDTPATPTDTAADTPGDNVAASVPAEVPLNGLDKDAWISPTEAMFLYGTHPRRLLKVANNGNCTSVSVRMDDGTVITWYSRQELVAAVDTLRETGRATTEQTADPIDADKVEEVHNEETTDMPRHANGNGAKTVDHIPRSPEDAVAMGLDPTQLFRNPPEPDPTPPEPMPEKPVRTVAPQHKLVPPPRKTTAWTVDGRLYREKPEIVEVTAWTVGEQLFPSADEALDFHWRTCGATTKQTLIGDGGERLMDLLFAMKAAGSPDLPDGLARLLDKLPEDDR